VNGPWTVYLFGGLRLERNGQSISRFRTQKAAALLAYLALYPTRVHSREELADRFWPDTDPEAGRANLRTALASLRRQLESGDPTEGGVLLARGRSELVLSPDAFQTDVGRFERGLRAASRPRLPPEEKIRLLRDAVLAYNGPFLPGFYDDWVLNERDRCEGLFLGALDQLTALLEAAGQWNDALDFARRALAVDPQREQIAQSVRRLQEAGRTAPLPRPEEAVIVERNAPIAEATENPPPPYSGDSGAPVHLPLSLTRFFGRDGEIAGLQELLSPGGPTRLVTITGPGGSGKTRLALEIARRLSPRFAGGVRFVGLADVRDPQQVPERIAASLGLLPTPLASPLDQVIKTLRQAGTGASLLLLDNYEQLVTAAGAALVAELMAGVPDLCCLVTSRQLLQIDGEREFALSPLPVPDHPGTPERLLEFPGVQMFVDRARMARADFPFNGRNAAAVSALCRKLEGIPLALELAAAWSQTLTPAQMLVRLQDRRCRADLLASRRRDQPERHATLRATVEWSYDLLSPDLQRFFRQLSVFQGGWTLEAAEFVTEEAQTLQFLTALRERSLILAEERGDAMRFRMLETLREFAEERRREDSAAEEIDVLRGRQAEWCLSLAEAAAPHLMGADQAAWLERLQVEQDNLRVALGFFLDRESAKELRLAVALFRFWQARGPIAEAHQWLEKGLEQPRTDDDEASSLQVRAQALEYSGTMAWYRSDVALARVRLEESIALSRELGDGIGIARAINSFAGMHSITSDTEGARDLLERGLAEMTALGGRAAIEGRRLLLESLTRDAVIRFEDAAAERYGTEWLHLAQEAGDNQQTSAVLNWLGYAAMNRWDYALGMARLTEALERAREVGAVLYSCSSLWGMGYIACFQGDIARAGRLQRDALRTIYGAAGYDFAVVYIIEAIALVALAAHQPPRQVARLMGAAARLRKGLGYPLAAVLRGTDLDAAREQVRAVLGDAAFESEFSAGAEMSPDEVFAEALAETPLGEPDAASLIAG
jgi:predicted ATPase